MLMVDTVLATSVSLKGEEDVQAIAYNVSHSRMVKISRSSIAVLDGGEGLPLWNLTSSWTVSGQDLREAAWCHPDFGQLVVVGSTSGDVHVWEEEHAGHGSPPTWVCKANLRGSTGSDAITSLSFAPTEVGPLLAVANTSGRVRIFGARNILPAESWSLEHEVVACEAGPCTSLSWRPHSPDVPPLLLTGIQTGATVWMYRSALMRWERAADLARGRPVIAVAWAPRLGRPKELVAVAQGSTALVCSLAGPANQLEVHEVARLEHASPVWHLEWNALGNWLAASTQDSQVHLWRPNLLGEWARQSIIAGSPDAPVDSDEDYVMVS